MAVYGESWLSEVGTQLRSVVDAFWGEVKQHGMLPLLEPVPPFNKPSFLSPGGRRRRAARGAAPLRHGRERVREPRR